jgi:hypothetical protein
MYPGDLVTNWKDGSPSNTGYGTKLRFKNGAWFAVMASSRKELRKVVKQILPEHKYRTDLVEQFTVVRSTGRRRHTAK